MTMEEGERKKEELSPVPPSPKRDASPSSPTSASSSTTARRGVATQQKAAAKHMMLVLLTVSIAVVRFASFLSPTAAPKFAVHTKEQEKHQTNHSSLPSFGVSRNHTNTSLLPVTETKPPITNTSLLTVTEAKLTNTSFLPVAETKPTNTPLLPVAETKPRSVERIAYKLYRGRPYTLEFQDLYRCGRPKQKGRVQRLPRELLKPGLFDFTTHVSTDLNILLTGDSVGMQLSHSFEEALGSTVATRLVLRYNKDHKEEYHVAAPLRGGGAFCGYRTNDFFRRALENSTSEEVPDDGFHWSRPEVLRVLNHTYPDLTGMNASMSMTTMQRLNDINDTTIQNIPKTTLTKFDVMIHRVTHGWIGTEDITPHVMTEHVELAHELFGVKSVIFISLPFINNVFTVPDYRKMIKAREELQKFSDSWPRGQAGVDQVLILDFGIFLDQLYEANARELGFNTSGGFEDWMLGHRLKKWRPRLPFIQNVAHVCGVKVEDDVARTCKGNRITFDGIHLCFESVGGRTFAAFACLISCAHNHYPPLEGNAIRACARECNQQFMHLTVLPNANLSKVRRRP